MQLLFNTITDWDEPPRVRHQISQGLFKVGFRNVFIVKNRFGFPRLGLREADGMLILSPYFIREGCSQLVKTSD